MSAGNGMKPPALPWRPRVCPEPLPGPYRVEGVALPEDVFPEDLSRRDRSMLARKLTRDGWRVENMLVYVPPGEELPSTASKRRKNGAVVRREWTPEEDAELVKLRRAGWTFPQIGRRMSRHKSSVRYRYRMVLERDPSRKEAAG